MQRADGRGRVELELAADPSAPAAARDVLDAVFGAEASSVLCQVAKLLTSELVANAVVHGRPPLRIRIELDRQRRVRVEVYDSSDQLPDIVPAGSAARRPSGLEIVELIASSWGSTRADGGKVVWFEVGPDVGGPAGPSTRSSPVT